VSNADQRATFRIDEFGKMLGVSKSTVWNRIKDGSIRTIRFGGATLIPRTELDRILSGAETIQ
jgi:excisionase family DNA binding protein